MRSERRLLAPLALACALAHGAAGAQDAAWSATLPTLEGERFVTTAALPGPVLLNFWGRDCPPCIAELPLLQTFAQAHPRWNVLLVATDSPADARRTLAQRGITLPALRGGPGVAALMRAAGNRHGALPFTLVTVQGRRCAHHAGALDAAALERLAAQCPPP